jgi:hypothetical protein
MGLPSSNYYRTFKAGKCRLRTYSLGPAAPSKAWRYYEEGQAFTKKERKAVRIPDSRGDSKRGCSVEEMFGWFCSWVFRKWANFRDSLFDLKRGCFWKRLFDSVNRILHDIVENLLKARAVEPEKEPLLAIGSETTFLSRQRPRK